MHATFLQAPWYSALVNHWEKLKSGTSANNQGCCSYQMASSHDAEDTHSTKHVC